MMTPRTRSFSGAALMLVIIPILAGLLACMPVPVGDPERSRIDQGLNGLWVLESDGKVDGMYQFLPWDKRSWLIVGAGLGVGSDFEGELPDIENVADLVAMLEEIPVGDDGITSESVSLYKAWMAKIGKAKFMTWEITGFGNDEGRIPPEYWFVFKVEKVNADRYNLHMLNGEFDGFDDIPKRKDYEGDDYVGDYRRAYERVIKRNLDNQDLVSDEDEAFMVLYRVPASAREIALELFEEIIEGE